MFNIHRGPMHMPLLTELVKKVVHLFLSMNLSVKRPPLPGPLLPRRRGRRRRRALGSWSQCEPKRFGNYKHGAPNGAETSPAFPLLATRVLKR